MADKTLLSPSFVDETMDELISDLQVLIRQPSVSALHQGLEECALILTKMMNKAGIRTELLYLNDLQQQTESSTILLLPLLPLMLLLLQVFIIKIAGIFHRH